MRTFFAVLLLSSFGCGTMQQPPDAGAAGGSSGGGAAVAGAWRRVGALQRVARREAQPEASEVAEPPTAASPASRARFRASEFFRSTRRHWL